MTWRVQVDWENDGSFGGTYDDITDDVLGELTWMNGARPFEFVSDEATLSLTLDNADRKYSPEYSSSPIYGDIEPGRPIRVQYTRDDAKVLAEYFDSFSSDTLYDLISSEERTTVDYGDAELDTFRSSTDISAIRLTGRFEPDYSEDYTFYVYTPDRSGVRLWINGDLVVDDPNGTGIVNTLSEKASDPITLTAGVRYEFRLEVESPSVNYPSDNALELRWSSASVSKEVIPAASLFMPNWLLWQGVIESISPSPLRYGPRTTAIAGVGPRRQLRLLQQVDLPYEEDAEPKDVLEGFFAGVNPFVDLSAFSDTYQTVPYFNDNLTQEVGRPADAWQIIRELITFEGGKLIYARGKWHLWGRQYLWNLSTTTDLTVNNTMSSMAYMSGIGDIINIAGANIYQRDKRTAPADEIQVYELTTDDDPLEVAYGDEKTFYFWFTEDSNPIACHSVTITTTTTDHGPIVNPVGSVALTQTLYGPYMKWTVDNNGPWAIWKVTALTIDGKPVRQAGASTVSAEDATSQATYGELYGDIESRLFAFANNAESYVSYLVQRFKDPAPRAETIMLSSEDDGTENSDLIEYGVGNTVRVVDYQTAHDEDYMIVGEQHSLSIASKTHNVTWFLEPIEFLRGFLILDDTTFGKLDTGRLGY